jgi:hypothetical protein
MVRKLAHYFQEMNPGLVGLWMAFVPIGRDVKESFV